MGNSQSNQPVTVKLTERCDSEDQKIQIAVSGMQGMRTTMEDRHLYSIGIPFPGGSLEDHTLLAVFDGHGGDFTSNYLKENFLRVFTNRPEISKYVALPKTGTKSRSDVTGVQLLRQALIRTFVELDRSLIPLQQERNQAILSGKIKPPVSTGGYDEDDEIKPKEKSLVGERSGSTATVVLMTPSHFICANTGDSRAVLQRRGKSLPLSFDHKPSDTPERRRVLAAGGTVKGKRVDGDLAVSRAFGDFTYKQDKELSVEKQKVIVVPELIVYPRDKEGDEFIIIACDGIWDVVSSQQCAEAVQMLLQDGELDLGNICEESLDSCLDLKSRDNMTMMLVGLPALKADTSSVAILGNVLFGHRRRRLARKITSCTGDMTHNACIAVGSELIQTEKALCA